MQEELFLRIVVDSFIIWRKPFDVLNENSFISSNESMSLDHQEVDLSLKSPNMTKTDGLRALMSDRRCTKCFKNFRILRCFDWESEKDLI